MIATVTSAALGSIRQDPQRAVDDEAAAPFMLDINGTDWREWWLVDSFTLNDTLGQPMACSFSLVNPSRKPRVGDVVTIRYYAETLFAGLLTRVQPQPNTDMSVLLYLCECADWSVLLTRRRLRRNFTNLPVVNIVDSLLDNELAGDGLTIGTVDQGANIPLVDVKNARAFDVLRDVAGATGQAMYVDFDKAIQFRTSTNETAPKPINDSTVEASSLVQDLETYRNVQTVIVTGTAPSGAEASVVISEDTNDDQIAARQAIEGGSGRYEDIEEVTHPTSNTTADLALLGLAVARMRLAISGTPRQTLRARLRGYGFRAGQFATVDLTGVGVSGTWLIQRSTFREQAARHLIFDLELTQSSRQQRAYESWLNIVKSGKITIQIPGALTSNLVTFNTPGTTTWTVPAGVTDATFTCIGGSGAGGGGSRDTSVFYPYRSSANGASGGNSGFAVTTISVTPGQVYTVVVGSGGTPGGTAANSGGYGGTGPSGTLSSVSLSAVVYCQGDPGTGGTGGFTAGSRTHYDGSPGTPGSGLGDAVTTGGGKIGGAGGTATTALANDGSIGQDGRVEIAY